MTFEDSYGTPNSHTKYLGMDARIAEALDALGLATTVWTRYIYYGKDGEQELRGEPIWEITAQPKPKAALGSRGGCGQTEHSACRGSGLQGFE